MADEVQGDAVDAGLSRRQLLKGGAAAGAALAAGGSIFISERASASVVDVDDLCGDSRDVRLINGRFIDHRGVITDDLTIKDGRIYAVGKAKDVGPCTRKYNLQGRTVIPGLIDSHAHFTRTGTNVGYETRWVETAFSIAELQQVIADRAASVPPGGMITAASGWGVSQFVENRLPTKAELDAATSTRGVYLNGRTNTVGAAFFAGFGITTDPVTGQVSSTSGATNALRSIQTFDDKVRGTADVIAYAAANGLTSIHCVGNLNVQPDDYDYMVKLYRDSGRQLDVKMRFYRYFQAGATLADLEAYIRATFNTIGDETFRVVGVGEQITPDPSLFTDALRIVAKYGWTTQRHTLSAAEHVSQVAAVKTVGTEFDISDLRWSLAHVPLLTDAQIADLMSVGAGVTVQDWLYLSTSVGPPFRRIVDSGIPAGAGTDASNVAPLSPWNAFFYMTTGRNLAGTPTNEAQKISRLEALKLYTVGSAYFSREENEVGTFEVGKRGDLVVLSDDFLTVPDDKLRKVKSLLTLVGGRQVHASAPFA